MRFTNHLRNSTKKLQRVIGNEHNIVNVDRYRISIKAGAGGSGLARFNGVGGDGGSVYFVARPNAAFADIAKAVGREKMVIRAPNGENASPVRLIAPHADDVLIPTPLGVEFVDEERNLLIGRCTRLHKKLLVARGGAGAKLANSFKPEKGEHVVLTAHLKLRPSVGLVGFPNAGKSTLLKAFIPKKSVKIAPYAFTTLKPQIGFWNPEGSNVEKEDTYTLTLADLPGLIEGASQNRGKGHEFLKHLEYCEMLLLVIDVNGFQLKNSLDEPFRTALETVALLNMELENYEKKIVYKPAVVFLNKCDIAHDQEKVKALCETLQHDSWADSLPPELRPKHRLTFDHVIQGSAKRNDVSELKSVLSRLHRNAHVHDVPADLIPDADNGKKNILV